MKKIFLILLFLIQCFPLFSKGYPEWFIYPKLYQGYITGFTYNGNSTLKDAEIMCCVFDYCKVEGYLETFESDNIKYLKNTNYHYVYLTEDISLIEGSLKKVSGFGTCSLNEDFVELFSKEEKNEVFKTKIIEIDETASPDWLKKFTFEDDKYYYGVGKFTSDNNCNDSWKTSEEQAIYNILTSISMKVYSVNRIENIEKFNDKYLSYVRTELKFEIYGIEVMERFPDENNLMYYTLVRIEKNKIKSLLNE